jgi:hypothetical protein
MADDVILPGTGESIKAREYAGDKYQGVELYVWNGSAMVPVTTTDRLFVDTELPTAAALADGTATPTTSQIGVIPLLSNGTTFDMQRGNQAETTIFSSAARTATPSPVNMTNHNARGLMLVLNVTAVTATPQLKVAVRWNLTGSEPNLWRATTNVATTGTYLYQIYPGATSGGGSQLTEAASIALPRDLKIVVEHGDSDSATYSLVAARIL